jgi:hypothetical protein
MAALPKIALLVETSNTYARGLLQGIAPHGARIPALRLRRRQQFQLVQEAGNDCSVRHFSTIPMTQPEASVDRIGAWIARLRSARQACSRRLPPPRGIQVPDEAAVIGVDNDEVFCALAEPSMSSIALDTRRTGYAAAALLDRMMAGESIGGEGHVFPA